MDTNDVKNFIKSRKFYIVIAVVFLLALLVGTFSFGVAIGYHKARFSYAWGENYHRNFGGPRGGFMRMTSQDLSGGDFIGGHGTFGQIIDVSGNEIAVRGRDNVEKIIIVNGNTDIRRFHDTIQTENLKADEFIVVIGEPNDQGQILGKFIRVMPASQSGGPGLSPMPMMPYRR